jgi:diguanylate cyclase (GGDEF)-like protein/PAS domain S-box-containing protein
VTVQDATGPLDPGRSTRPSGGARRGLGSHLPAPVRAAPWDAGSGQADHLLRVLLEHARDVVATVDRALVLTSMSPSIERLTGFGPEHYLGTPLADHLHEGEDLAALRVPAPRSQVRVPAERRRIRRWDDTYVEVEVQHHDRLDDPVVASIVLNISDLSESDESLAAVRSSEDRYRRIVAETQEAIVVVDPDGVVMVANGCAEQLFGVSSGAMLTRTLDELGIGGAARSAVLGEGTGGSARVEVPLRDDADEPWTSIASDPLFDQAGTLVGHLALASDITDARAATAELAARAHQQAAVARLGTQALGIRELDVLLRAVLQTAVDELDLDRACVFVLDAASEQLVLRAAIGWRPDDLGRTVPAAPASTIGRFVHEERDPVVLAGALGEGSVGRALGLPERGVRSGLAVSVFGEHPMGVLVVGSTAPRSYDAQEVSFVTGLVNVLAAAVDRDRAEAEAWHRFRHDPLTGLVNRSELERCLRAAVAAAGRDRARPALLLLDLDGLKLVNDALGLTVGDEVLRRVADRLAAVVGDRGVLGRFDGDVFAVLVEAADVRSPPQVLAQELVEALQEAHHVDGREVFVTTGLGVALGDELPLGEPTERAATLLRNADLALKAAKRLGRNRFEVFDEAMREDAEAVLTVATALRGAEARGELHVRYQPQIDFRTDEARVEALVRWNHPTLGAVGPAQFIPIAEQTGLIGDLGDWVLEQAVRQMAVWNAEPEVRPTVVSVNLSPRQLALPGLVEHVVHTIERHGVEPASLCLEITETAMVSDADAALAIVARLRALGVEVAIDDFGTGFSSLARLQHLPVTALKVDQTFVAGLTTRQSDRSIVAAVIALAHGLGLAVVAEGVETAAQLEILRELGCDGGQGYLWSPALPPDELVSWFDARAERLR